VGRTQVANKLLAGSACGKRRRARPLNSVVRRHSTARTVKSRKRAIIIAALCFGVVMTSFQWISGEGLWMIGAFGYFLGILVSRDTQLNPIMIVTMTLYWAAVGWIVGFSMWAAYLTLKPQSKTDGSRGNDA
jgi:hypothetical protein